MFKILGKTVDLRSGANVVYCQCSPSEYLSIIGKNFSEFAIQRKRENHKAYRRLKADIIDGALLPTITLSVKHHLVEEVLSLTDDESAFFSRICSSECIDILDGLQRSYILNDIAEDHIAFKDGQQLLLEFWFESDLSKLIYRMIVLNSGQKAMSTRHQIELLFMSLKETIEIEVSGIEIITERDAKRRTQPNRYSLNNIASAYQSFVSKSHETDRENMIAQKLIDEDSFDSSEDELGEKFRLFISYYKIFKEIDSAAWAKYSASNIPEINDFYDWLGSENTMLSLFSAIAQYIELNRQTRIESALTKLLEYCRNPDIEDPLGLATYSAVKSGLNPRKSNIGFATRKLIHNSFKEFFREEGQLSLEHCWNLASE